VTEKSVRRALIHSVGNGEGSPVVVFLARIFLLVRALREMPCCDSGRNGQDEGNEDQVPTFFEQIGRHDFVSTIIRVPKRKPCRVGLDDARRSDMNLSGYLQNN
jgi:hypothetical protein